MVMQMTNQLLNIIRKRFPLSKIDVGSMKTLKASGMKFNVEAYHAEGLGHVSVMRASGFFGLMKMDTLIINPDAIDLPLYSYDRIFAAGNDTLIVELYDTMAEKQNLISLEEAKQDYSSLAERDPGENSYLL